MFFGSEAPVGTEINVSKPTALRYSCDTSEETSEDVVICHCAFGELSEHCPPNIPWVNITKQLEQLARNKLNWREINLTHQNVTSNISDGVWGRSQHAELLSSPAAPLASPCRISHSHTSGCPFRSEGTSATLTPTPWAEQLTCGTGIDNPCSRQLVLQVQHCFAHFGRAGVFGFVAFIKHNLQGSGS